MKVESLQLAMKHVFLIVMKATAIPLALRHGNPGGWHNPT
jgi:hypothetical protein